MFNATFDGADLLVFLSLFAFIYVAHQAGWTR